MVCHIRCEFAVQVGLKIEFDRLVRCVCEALRSLGNRFTLSDHRPFIMPCFYILFIYYYRVAIVAHCSSSPGSSYLELVMAVSQSSAACFACLALSYACSYAIDPKASALAL